ncbi:hypothetical protein [Enterococcus sp. HMSC067C01]|uniref:hypothetical protein n=1 Tax=Enterococcus sp. HMSC067C01 TaxID=1739370 RepID=UPI00210D5F96|nr:hypothetical protein [Enterococcus sp. HMSC067C01]
MATITQKQCTFTPTYFYVLFDNPILKKNKTKKLEGYHVCAFIFPMNEGRSVLKSQKRTDGSKSTEFCPVVNEERQNTNV